MHREGLWDTRGERESERGQERERKSDWSSEASGTLSSVSWKVVGVQIVVACALRQAVVSVQKALWLVHRFQVVVRLVGLRLEQAAKQSGNL